MAFKVKSKKKEQEPARQAPARTMSRSAVEGDRQKAAEQRQRAMDGFHPSVVDFLKSSLGLDLSKLDTSVLYDLQQGKLTKPLELVVVPLSYDYAKKASVAMPPIKSVASVRLMLPYEGGKPVAIDDKHRVFVATVPCRPMIEKADGAAVAEAAAPAPAGAEERELPKFTEAQLMALEGIGISRERMFGGFNRLSKDVKLDIADGERFYVDGAVKTSFGLVNVIGEARLSTDANGVATADFMPAYPEERSAGKVLDILDARINGNLELDFFRRSAEGKVITSVSGEPMLNTAGENLVRYGMAMEPVRGFIHRHDYDGKEKKYVDSVEVGMYQVSAVNGNLFATRMKEVEELAPDGTKTKRVEIPNARVRDGKVFVDGKNEALEFASERDLKEFVAGRSAVVKDAVYHDFKSKKDVKYDAVVVSDNTRSGYARQFTPETSRKILERREQKIGPRKRQNFKMGI